MQAAPLPTQAVQVAAKVVAAETVETVANDSPLAEKAGAVEVQPYTWYAPPTSGTHTDVARYCCAATPPAATAVAEDRCNHDIEVAQDGTCVELPARVNGDERNGMATLVEDMTIAALPFASGLEARPGGAAGLTEADFLATAQLFLNDEELEKEVVAGVGLSQECV